MGHGDHWRAVLPNPDDFVRYVSQAPVIARHTFPPEKKVGEGTSASLTVLSWPAGGIRLHYFVVKNNSTGRPYLHTAFPSPGEGCRHEVRIDSLQDSSFGVEGTVCGTLGDTELCFSDPFFPINRAVYRPSSSHSFELAAVAYSLKTHEPGAVLKSAAGDIALSGSALLLNLKDRSRSGYPTVTGREEAFGIAYIDSRGVFDDDYEYLATVRQVTEFRLDDTPLWKFRVLAKYVCDATQEVEIDLYAASMVLESGIVPGPGDAISGRLWLQGSLALSPDRR